MLVVKHHQIHVGCTMMMPLQSSWSSTFGKHRGSTCWNSFKIFFHFTSSSPDNRLSQFRWLTHSSWNIILNWIVRQNANRIINPRRNASNALFGWLQLQTQLANVTQVKDEHILGRVPLDSQNFKSFRCDSSPPSTCLAYDSSSEVLWCGDAVSVQLTRQDSCKSIFRCITDEFVRRWGCW